MQRTEKWWDNVLFVALHVYIVRLPTRRRAVRLAALKGAEEGCGMLCGKGSDVDLWRGRCTKRFRQFFVAASVLHVTPAPTSFPSLVVRYDDGEGKSIRCIPPFSIWAGTPK